MDNEMEKEKERVLCEECGELEIYDIGQYTSATVFYGVYVEDEDIKYENKEIVSSQFYQWFCRKCGCDIETTYVDVIRIYGGKNG